MIMSKTNLTATISTTSMSMMPEHKRIADIFPENGISIVLGEIGIGKTYSTLLALKLARIVPYWFNLDKCNMQPDFTDQDVKNCTDVNQLMNLVLNSNVMPPRDMEVLMIDSLTRLKPIMDSQSDFVAGLERLTQYGITIILTAHPEKLATAKVPVLKGWDYIMDTCDELMYLDRYTTMKDKKAYGRNPYLRLVKARMYKGNNPIHNWMRNDGVTLCKIQSW
jgi:hypothetical protein